MGYIIAIETATKNCSVALAKDGICLSILEIANQNYSHAEKLHDFIKQILDNANISFDQLDAIAVSKGPGSYTGLRIGVSAAKGLCFALNIPLIALDTLYILAHQITNNNKLIIPVIDARRLEIYCAIYSFDYQLIRPVEAHILNQNSFIELENPLIFIGDCVDKCKEILTISNATFISSYPSAKEICYLSYQKFIQKDFEDIAYFEPFYLKDFILN